MSSYPNIKGQPFFKAVVSGSLKPNCSCASGPKQCQKSSRLSKHKIADFQTKTKQENNIPLPHGFQLYLLFIFFEKYLQGKNFCLRPEVDKQSKCFEEIFKVRLRLLKI